MNSKIHNTVIKGNIDIDKIKNEVNLVVFPDGHLYVGDISHDMLIYNTVREHSEYSDILQDIENWIKQFEGSSASCWGYCGIVLGYDFAIRHNIVKIYGIENFRKHFLLCSDTAHNLTREQIKTLYLIKSMFGNMDQRSIEREYKYMEEYND